MFSTSRRLGAQVERGISKRFISQISACRSMNAGSGRPDSTGPSSAKISRFYNKVGVVPSKDKENWFNVTLDGRNLRTPQKSVLSIPCISLAHMVAQEWNCQDKHIETSNMHLTSLCNTAQDKPDKKSKDLVVKDVLEFLYTDTVSFREEDPPDLYEFQCTTWDPMIDWFNKKHDVQVPIVKTILAADMTEDEMQRMEDYVSGYNDWALCGLHFATITAKSFVIADSVISGTYSGEEAAHAARVEVIFQTGRFGEVEWAHPMEAADTTSRLAAASVFTQLVSSNPLVASEN
eukprot:m.36080 g.36080  ORF g.36080 m.36080 type:complete len:291 (-) comp17255_c0_seq1:81-953(-)